MKVKTIMPRGRIIGLHGLVCLVDMGFAKKKEPGALCFTMCGTPEYLAPEIILGEGYDEVSYFCRCHRPVIVFVVVIVVVVIVQRLID